MPLFIFLSFHKGHGLGGGEIRGNEWEKRNSIDSKRVEGTPDVSLIEMKSSAYVFFGDNNANVDRSEGIEKRR